MKPKQIKIVDKDKISFLWNDETITVLTLKYLRDECPCANCKGETVLFKTYRPARPATSLPEMYKIESINEVGGYAIQINWKDGHDTGIYSWEYIKLLEAGASDNLKQQYDNLV